MPQPAEIKFVGESHKHLAAELLSSYREVDESHQPSLVCITAPQGHGKTRIVQEFYALLAAQEQSLPKYWPNRITRATDALQSRKTIYPDRFHKAHEAAIPWLWWGISCGRRNLAAAQALAQDITQLEEHGPALRARWRALVSMRQRAGRALRREERRRLGALVGAAAAEELAGEAVKAALNTAVPLAGFLTGQLVRGLSALHENRGADSLSTWGRLVDAERAGRPDLVNVVLTELPELAEVGIPVVLIVEDAHLADASLLTLLSALMAKQGCPILIILTAWPEGLSVGSPLGTLLRDLRHHERVQQVVVPALGAEDLSQVVLQLAPATPAGTVSAVVEHLPTPLLILEAFNLRRYVDSVDGSGALRLTAEQVRKTPRRLVDLYVQRWEELPSDVRQVLVVAVSTTPQVLIGGTSSDSRSLLVPTQVVAEGLGVTNPERRLSQARDPLAWLSISDDLAIGQFLEPVMNEVVTERLSEMDQESRARSSRHALAEYAPNILTNYADLRLSAETVRVVAERYSMLALNGYAPADRVAHNAALTAARLAHDAYDYESAIAHMRHAILWSPEDGTETSLPLALQEELADWLGECGSVSEAIEMQETFLVQHVAARGRAHPRTLTARLRLGLNLGDAGRRREQFTQVLNAVADALLTYGPDHAFVVLAQNNLISALLGPRDRAAALQLCQTVLADRIMLLGPNHPLTWASRGNLAFLLEQSGDLNAALSLAERVHEALIRQHGADHPSTFLSEVQVRGLQLGLHTGETAPDDVLAFVKDAVHRLPRAAILPSRGDAGLSAMRHGWAQSRVLELRALHEKVVAEQGQYSQSARVVLEVLAEANKRAGDKVGEVEVWEQLLAWPGDESTHDDSAVLHNLARALVRAERHDEAVAVYAQLLQAWQHAPVVEHKRVLVMTEYVAALRASGRYPEAVHLQQELIAQHSAVKQELANLAARADLGLLLFESGRHNEACTELQRVHAGRVALLGDGHPEAQSTLLTLALWQSTSGDEQAALANVGSLLQGPAAFANETYEYQTARLLKLRLTSLCGQDVDAVDVQYAYRHLYQVTAEDTDALRGASLLPGRMALSSALAAVRYPEPAIAVFQGFLSERVLVMDLREVDHESARVALQARYLMSVLALRAGRDAHECAEAGRQVLSDRQGLIVALIEEGRGPEAVGLLEDELGVWEETSEELDEELVAQESLVAQTLRGLLDRIQGTRQD
jgi:tetratricopeptide (TPR) repeat protein